MSFFSVSSITLRLRRSFLLALAFAAVLVLGTAGQAHAQFTVTRTSAADFFIEQGVATQNCSYVSYLVTNTGATPQSDVWVRIGNFGGGVISLGGGQSNKFPIGTINNGASKAAFFYLTASGVTSTAQTHDITVFLGDPDNGGVQQTTSSFSITTVQDTIKAAANKITGGGVTPTGTVNLGDPIVVTLNGQSGTLGAGPGGTVPANQLYFAGPSALSTFPAGAFRIVSTRIVFADTTTVTDRLATTRATSSATDYTVEYTLQAVNTTNAPTPVNPYAYINSGTQVKYTDPGTFGSIAIPQVVQSLVLTLTATPSTQAPNSTITFTLRATNNGTLPATLSNFIVDASAFITAGGSYDGGSSTFNANGITDPNINAGVLTFTGSAPYTIPAGGFRDLVFTMTTPASAGGPYACSATATRTDLAGSVPATSTPLNVTVATLQTPTLTNVNPNPASVGGTVTLTGTNFTGVSSISFNGTPCTEFTVVSPTEITATVPTGATTGNVTVTNGAGTSNGVNLTITAPPTITLLNPSSGPAGTTVIITGTNFTGTTAVNFGNVPATSFTVDSATQITCVVPANYGAFVTVTANGSVSNQAQYGAPVITSLTPAAAVAGTTITISGQSFTGATGVSFGNVPATSFIVNNDNTITAVVPPGAGAFVTVTTPLGTSNQAPFGAPVITSVSPSSGTAGATITLSGQGFTGATAVSFGGVPATSFTVNNDGTITVVVPPGFGDFIEVTTPRGVSNQVPFGAGGISGVVVPSVPGGGTPASDASGNVTLNPFQIRNTGTTQQFLVQLTIAIDNPALFSQATLVATSAAGSRTSTLTQLGTSNIFVLSSPLLLQPGESANINITVVSVKAAAGGAGGLTVLSLMLPLLFVPRRTRKVAVVLAFAGVLTLGLAGCSSGGGGINGQRDGAYNAINAGGTGVANVDLTQIVAKGPNNETVIYGNLPQHLYTITII